MPVSVDQKMSLIIKILIRNMNGTCIISENTDRNCWNCSGRLVPHSAQLYYYKTALVKGAYGTTYIWWSFWRGGNVRLPGYYFFFKFSRDFNEVYKVKKRLLESCFCFHLYLLQWVEINFVVYVIRRFCLLEASNTYILQH